MTRSIKADDGAGRVTEKNCQRGTPFTHDIDDNKGFEDADCHDQYSRLTLRSCNGVARLRRPVNIGFRYSVKTVKHAGTPSASLSLLPNLRCMSYVHQLGFPRIPVLSFQFHLICAEKDERHLRWLSEMSCSFQLALENAATELLACAHQLKAEVFRLSSEKKCIGCIPTFCPRNSPMLGIGIQVR